MEVEISTEENRIEKIFNNRESLEKLGKAILKRIFESTSNESKIKN